jgi:hypothetical protein
VEAGMQSGPVRTLDMETVKRRTELFRAMEFIKIFENMRCHWLFDELCGPKEGHI